VRLFLRFLTIDIVAALILSQLHLWLFFSR